MNMYYPSLSAVWDYFTDTERRQLGHHQLRMLGFARRAADQSGCKRFSIARDALTRRVATSLERRGLLCVRRDAGDCWLVWLP